MKSIIKNQAQLLSIIVVCYMLLALAWWFILLMNQNELIFDLLKSNPEITKENLSSYQRQRFMIIGEGLVFGISLIVGIIIVYRALRTEIESAKQQKNFLLSVTHELKSPIAAMKLILETFKSRDLKKEQTEELAFNGLTEAERLNKLVQDLLITAKIGTNIKLEKSQLELIQFIEKIQQYYLNQGKVVEIQNETGKTVFVSTHTDSLQLILSNLIDNAVKYSPENEPVWINIKNLEQSISVSVIDKGIGIPDKERNKIFNQFYRIGNEYERSSKGTGLGLFIVKQLCQKLNIQLKMGPNKPRGSVFSLYIPN